MNPLIRACEQGEQGGDKGLTAHLCEIDVDLKELFQCATKRREQLFYFIHNEEQRDNNTYPPTLGYCTHI